MRLGVGIGNTIYVLNIPMALEVSFQKVLFCILDLCELSIYYSRGLNELCVLHFYPRARICYAIQHCLICKIKRYARMALHM